MITHKRQSGFTLIELLVVMLIVGILGTLVAMTYGGVQAKDRNDQRQADINTLKSHLETYYTQATKYPSLSELNDPNWRKQHMKDLAGNQLIDPSWSEKTKGCVEGTRALIVGTPTTNCYAYQVRASDGAKCDNSKIICAHYTLTAVLETGDRYVKSSLN